MSFLWVWHCFLGAYLLHDTRTVSEEDYISQFDPPDSLSSILNASLMSDGVAGLGVMDGEEFSNVCTITVLTGALAAPSEQEGTAAAAEDDLGPVKSLMNGSSSVLESLASAVIAEIGKVSYQSLISETVLDIKQRNEQSNNIMTEIFQTLDSAPTSDHHVTKFKEKVCKMEAMLQAIDHLASQVEQMSDTLSTELNQHLGMSRKMESTLYQKAN
ncbi:uncharacterized protein LOC144504266 [Mustelus asterias]